MTLHCAFRAILAATAILAVAALGGMGWYNWWIRYTWMPIHPVC